MSVPKTIEEILGLPAMGYGDLLANDLIETERIWNLTGRLDNATYDADTARLGQLTDLYFDSLKLAKHGDSTRQGSIGNDRTRCSRAPGPS